MKGIVVSILLLTTFAQCERNHRLQLRNDTLDFDCPTYSEYDINLEQCRATLVVYSYKGMPVYCGVPICMNDKCSLTCVWDPLHPNYIPLTTVIPMKNGK